MVTVWIMHSSQLVIFQDVMWDITATLEILVLFKFEILIAQMESGKAVWAHAGKANIMLQYAVSMNIEQLNHFAAICWKQYNFQVVINTDHPLTCQVMHCSSSHNLKFLREILAFMHILTSISHIHYYNKSCTLPQQWSNREYTKHNFQTSLYPETQLQPQSYAGLPERPM